MLPRLFRVPQALPSALDFARDLARDSCATQNPAKPAVLQAKVMTVTCEGSDSSMPQRVKLTSHNAELQVSATTWVVQSLDSPFPVLYRS